MEQIFDKGLNLYQMTLGGDEDDEEEKANKENKGPFKYVKTTHNTQDKAYLKNYCDLVHFWS